MRILMLLLGLFCLGCDSSSTSSLITVYGSAVIKAPPEKFDISLRLRSRHQDPARAQRSNQQKLGLVKQLLTKQKVRPQDFVVVSSTLTQEEAQNTEKPATPAAFIADQELTVTFSSAREREQLFVAVSRHQVAEVTAQSESLLEPASIRNQARLEAIRQASYKAAAMAKELHRGLGEAITVQEENDSSAFYSAGNNHAKAYLPIDPDYQGSGLIEESARVQVSFRLR